MTDAPTTRYPFGFCFSAVSPVICQVGGSFYRGPRRAEDPSLRPRSPCGTTNAHVGNGSNHAWQTLIRNPADSIAILRGAEKPLLRARGSGLERGRCPATPVYSSGSCITRSIHETRVDRGTSVPTGLRLNSDGSSARRGPPAWPRRVLEPTSWVLRVSPSWPPDPGHAECRSRVREERRLNRLPFQILHRRGVDHRPVPLEPRTVARAVPRQLGRIPAHPASQMGAIRRNRHRRPIGIA